MLRIESVYIGNTEYEFNMTCIDRIAFDIIYRNKLREKLDVELDLVKLRDGEWNLNNVYEVLKDSILIKCDESLRGCLEISVEKTIDKVLEYETCIYVDSIKEKFMEYMEYIKNNKEKGMGLSVEKAYDMVNEMSDLLGIENMSYGKEVFLRVLGVEKSKPIINALR